VDALAPFGVRDVAMPATPERIVAALAAAQEDRSADRAGERGEEAQR
jgi:hypothetical protein